MPCWCGRAERCEHAALALWRPFGPERRRHADVAPLGKVAGHILGSFARQDAGQFAQVVEVVSAVVQLNAAPMPRQGDVGAVTIHPWRRQHVRAIDGDALALVDRRRIAVIDLGVILEVEGDAAAAVEPHGHPRGRDLLDLAQHAVLHPQPAIVLQEHQPVAGRELARGALSLDGHVLAQRASLAQPAPRRQIEIAHLVIGVGEDDPALIRLGDALAVPALDQILAGLVAGVGDMDHSARLIGGERLAGAAGGQMPCSVALPVFMLATNLGDLDMGMPLGDRAERRARLDRLQLLGIADQDHLGASPLGRRQQPLHLARADHSGLVDHQDVARRQQFTPLRPLMLQAGDGSRGHA